MYTMNVLEIVHSIDPGELMYDDWLAVGMVLKNEGLSVSDWDSWSKQDTKRYREGECQRKWDTFSSSGRMTGTLVHIAREQGVSLPYHDNADRPVVYDDWSFTIPAHDKGYVVAPALAPKYVVAPTDWNPKQQIKDYLNALFEPEDVVGYVLTATDDGKPRGKGNYTRTVSEIIEALDKSELDEALFCTPNTQFGGWMRLNPLDGEGVADLNVTQYKHVLVEADDIEIEDQAGLYEALELPIAALVHSGNKSLHAVVKIDAVNREEYDRRTTFLFDVLEKNGLEKKARRNRNPSRLSRMPGLVRGFNKQYLISTHTGKSTFAAWQEWIEEINDNLPDFENWAEVSDDMPELAPAIISDLLRQGHKMLLSGASKAGKSFLLLQLCMAVAHGRDWLGWGCTEGKVLYVNLELDRASCFNRIHMIEQKLGLVEPRHIRKRSNLEVWNLRGSAEPMRVLAPKLIRRAKKRNFDMIVIDPIYKVITGAENEAGDMAEFCNQFDKVAHQLGAAVVYCHHHSKGEQGQKAAMDRASGSGVFARDPDAIIDLIELNPTVEVKETFMARHLGHESSQSLSDYERDEAHQISAWRVECALREFATPDMKRIWFQYPLHVMDNGSLDSARAAGETLTERARRIADEQRVRENPSMREMISNAFDTIVQLDNTGENFVHLGALANAVGTSQKNVGVILNRHPDLCITHSGKVYEKREVARMALEGKAKGKSYNDISDAIGGLKYTCPKSRISRWIKDYFSGKGPKFDLEDDIIAD